MGISFVRRKITDVSSRGIVWVYAALAAVMAMLCMGALAACASSDFFLGEEENGPVEVGEVVEVNERSATSGDGLVPVQMRVLSCFVGTELPEGFGAEDVCFYDEEREAFNRENGLYVIGENGALSEGWCLIMVSVEAWNETDEACRVSLSAGSVDVGHFEGDLPVAVNKSESWIKDGKETKEEYYLPLLGANSSACYDVGFFVRIDELTTNGQLIFRSPGDKGTVMVSSIALGDLMSQLDAVA